VNSLVSLQSAESAKYVPAECREEWAKVGLCKARYLVAGAGDPILLLHGLLGYSFSWRKVIGPLSQRGQVFAPDMPGSGFSACATDLDCHLSSAAKRLAVFLDSVGISSCDLVASSYGGATALLLATQQPERFRRMVLVSPANSWSRTGAKRIRLLQTSAVRWLFPKAGQKLRCLHNYFLRRLYGDPARITPEAYRGYSQPIALGGRLEHAVRIVQSWQEDMEELRLALPRAAAIPVLLIWGGKDAAVDLASAAMLRCNFRAAEIALIHDAGHLPYEEQPEEFLRIVNGFLNMTTGK